MESKDITKSKDQYSEKQLEKNFSNYVNSFKNCYCLKFLSTVSGIPDRVVLINGTCFFVEFKSTGRPLRAIQTFWKKQLEAAGFKYMVVDDENSLNAARIYALNVKNGIS